MSVCDLNKVHKSWSYGFLEEWCSPDCVYNLLANDVTELARVVRERVLDLVKADPDIIFFY